MSPVVPGARYRMIVTRKIDGRRFRQRRPHGDVKEWRITPSAYALRAMADKSAPIRATGSVPTDLPGSVTNAKYRSPPDYAHLAALPIKPLQAAGGRRSVITPDA